MIKVELHAHTKDDPSDRIFHGPEQLIDRAATLGYGAVAITLHNRWTDPAPLREHAESRGITVIAGIERNIGRKHVLLINAPRDAERVRTFADVAALKAATGTLVVVPHAFYPIPTAMGPLLDDMPDLVDAIEVNSMYVRGIDFNRKAIEWAARHGKPVVGNTDLHLLAQLGTTYSLVESPSRDAGAICDAIRAGLVRVVSEPLGWVRAALIFSCMVAGGLGPSPGRRREQQEQEG